MSSISQKFLSRTFFVCMATAVALVWSVDSRAGRILLAMLLFVIGACAVLVASLDNS